jgi:hypothetical protein
MHVFWPFACCAKIGVLDDGSELNVETLVISAFFFLAYSQMLCPVPTLSTVGGLALVMMAAEALNSTF